MKMHLSFVLFVLSCWLVPSGAFIVSHMPSEGFQRLVLPSFGKLFSTATVQANRTPLFPLQMTSDVSTSSTVDLHAQRIIPYGPHLKLGSKKKILNLCGLMFFLSIVVSSFVTFPFVCISHVIGLIFDRKRQRLADFCISMWARFAMMLCFYYPKIEGKENLPKDSEGVLYLANHTSYLDILTLSAFLGRSFKYVSKIEVLKVPIIGWSMQLAGHIAVARTNRESQIKTVANTVQALKQGNSVCMFPEGTRTTTGRLNNFKKGSFVIAKKAGARIVPISLCNVTKWFPSWAWMPLARPSDIVIKIHPPIDPKDLSEADLFEQTYSAIESGLPDFQRRL